jgi:hypothetical protein
MDDRACRPVQVLDRDRGSIRVAVKIPEGYRFLPDRHHYLVVLSSNEDVLEVPPILIDDLSFDWEVPVEVLGEGETTLEMMGLVFFCPATEGLVCIYGRIEDHLTVRVEAGSGGEVEFVHHVEAMEMLAGGHASNGPSWNGHELECDTAH